MICIKDLSRLGQVVAQGSVADFKTRRYGDCRVIRILHIPLTIELSHAEAKTEKIDSSKPKQSNTPAQTEVVTKPQPGKQPSVTNDSELQYRGFQRSGGQLTAFLEDPTSGQYFTLQDFDCYRRQGWILSFTLQISTIG